MTIIEVFSFLSDVWFVVFATIFLVCLSVFIVKEIVNMFRSSKVNSVTYEELLAESEEFIIRQRELVRKFEFCLKEVRHLHFAESEPFIVDSQKDEDNFDET